MCSFIWEKALGPRGDVTGWQSWLPSPESAPSRRLGADAGPGACWLPVFPLSSSVMLIWLLLVTAIPHDYCSSRALNHSDGYNLTWTNLPNSSPLHFFHAKGKAGRFSNRPCDFSIKRLPLQTAAAEELGRPSIPWLKPTTHSLWVSLQGEACFQA